MYGLSLKRSLRDSFLWAEPLLLTALASLIVFEISRVGIIAWQFDRVVATGASHFPFVLLQGLRFDIVTLGILLGVPAILSPVFMISRFSAAVWMPVVRVYSLIVLGAVVFMEFATPSFINEFDAKPDRRFIEYLIYPKEIFSTLWTTHRPQLIMAAISVGIAVYVLNRVLRARTQSVPVLRIWAPLVLVPLTGFIVLAAIRSTTDHRPVNPSTVVFSSDPLANEMALNSTYTTLYALYEMLREDSQFPYRKVAFEEAVAAVRNNMLLPSGLFVEGKDSTMHRHQATRSYDRPLNLVIVLEESLGAEFVGALGGLPLTPELDSLQNQGIWFDRLYATGTRSVRGIEAVVSGYPPTTARSTVKLSRSQRNFFTVAGLLAARGYSTSFLYGGEPQFDNMGRFFANNGFQTIIGRHDFTGDVFDGGWGVSDGDMFRLADDFFRRQPADKPFFSLLFTTSNHSPWDYPEGSIEPYNSPAATRENSVKYADHALGEFLRTARNSPYWDNTVFLVIADHCSRTYGAELVPIERFHIPGVILGGTIDPQKISRVVSQIDMLPTLLSLIGVSGNMPAIGIDQTRTDLGDFPGRAVMQYGGNQAYMEGNRVAILQKRLPASEYVYASGTLVPATGDREFLNKAEALANWPWQAYMKGSYHLPPEAMTLR